MVTSRGTRISAARGFSLIELLVVMFIIGLVVAITIPALGYARTLAKKTTTLAFMTGLSQSCAQFQALNRRMPGYFSPREMGDATNIATGFTAMDNVLLDLSGGVTAAAPNGTSIFNVGPTPTARVNVDIDKIGVPAAGSTVYWAPEAKNFEAQSAQSKPGDPVNLNIKSVVDSFGQPILFWATDEASLTPITPPDAYGFANVSVGANGTASSKFYWASNASYLSSTALGKRGKDQTSSTGSLWKPGATNLSKTMAAYLGNPSAIANPADAGGQPNWVPSAGRGKFMIQSAGTDGVFLSTEDGGARKNGLFGMTFANNFLVGSNKPADLTGDFDDLLVSGGN